MKIDLTTPGNIALALLDTIVEMSDRAEQLGGARSIAGVAALNTLQTSIQKNKLRLRHVIDKARKEALDDNQKVD